MAVWKFGSYAAALLLARKHRLEMRGAGRFEARPRLALVGGRFGDFRFFLCASLRHGQRQALLPSTPNDNT